MNAKVEQLAGDLLPNATMEQKMATAFHRNTMTNTEGGTDQEQFRIEAVNLFNNVNLGNPDTEIGTPGNDRPNAGRINSTAYFGADPQRNLQFALKFTF